jgi:hypothetical protein
MDSITQKGSGCFPGANVGGNWNNGSNDGRFALNLNNAPSNTNNNIGFRCALPEVNPVELHANGFQARFMEASRFHAVLISPQSNGVQGFGSSNHSPEPKPVVLRSAQPIEVWPVRRSALAMQSSTLSSKYFTHREVRRSRDARRIRCREEPQCRPQFSEPSAPGRRRWSASAAGDRPSAREVL